MKQEMNYSGYVDKYLDGILDPKDEEQFERELKYDEDLQAELSLQQKLQNMIEDTEVFLLKQQLDTIYQEQYTPWVRKLQPKILKNKKTIVRVSALAASVTFIVFSITALLNQNFGTTESLYSKYYETPEISMSFRSAADQVDNDLRSAMVHYENKEYTKAIALFEKVLNQDNSRIGLNLYSGISNMEIQEYEKANENFQKIIDHSTNAFVESAEWYLGLCYLKTEEMNKAKSVFSDIANREGYFRKDARKVLRKIK